MPVDALGLLVPGRIPYRPLATGIGVVTGEARIGTRTRRRLHWPTYAIFAAGTAHGPLAGTDSGLHWMR